MKTLIIFIVSIMIVFSACELATPLDTTLITPGVGEGGTLYLNLNSDVNRSATITPMVLSIASYVIECTHNNPTITITEIVNVINVPVYSHQITGLETGLWNVSVDAYNEADGEGALIATDNATGIEIQDDSITPVNIVVEPLSGNGNLELSLSWPTIDGVANPGIDAYLDVDLVTGGEIYLAISDIVAQTASCIATDIPAGYYYLTMTLTDNGTAVSITEKHSVRIITEDDTTGTVNFVDSIGGTDLIISYDLNNPFDLVFFDEPSFLYQTTTPNTMIVSVAIVPSYEQVGGVGDKCEWFLNGIDVTGGNKAVHSITINSIDHPLGFYILTTIVTKDSAMSAKAFNFSIVPDP